jgi:iron complex outermembrane recepter protein
MTYKTRIALAGISLLAIAQPSYAQTSAPADEQDGGDIVVTGTFIRGNVVGSQTLAIDAKAIADKGAFSTNELLGTIPQIANVFNGRIEGDPRGYQGSGTSITRPNLRNLPSTNTTSGALTLLLADGMRLTPVGVNQSSADADIIPTAVLANVGIVTDGGSSLYGADAVVGVMDFITLRKFDGIKVDGNLGLGTTIKGWKQWDAGITAGTSWSGGNAYIYVGHSQRDLIINSEVPWSSGLVYNAAGVGSFNQTQCPSPVGTETRWFRFGAGAANFTNNPAAPGAGTFPVGTPCDSVSASTYFPQQERTNVFGAVSQELGDTADLRVTGYWMKRETELAIFPRGMTAAGSPLTTGALVGAAFPNATVGSLTAVPGGTSFSFSPNAAYVNRPQTIGIETWGITPEVTVKLPHEWQLRGSMHFGRSTNSQTFPGVDQVKGQCYITGCTGIAAGQLNPLNVAAASASVITDITNFESAQETKQQMFLVRAIVDGPVFALPGGDAKVALGAEFQENRAQSRLSTGTIGSVANAAWLKSTRNSKSIYGEVLLPVVSFADVTASVRHDSYSDFGDTTNPSVRLTIKPTSTLRFYGQWNKSFNAPTAVDNLSIGTGRFVCGIYVPGSTNAGQRPNDPLGRDTSKQGSCAMVLQGSGGNLKPQTAESWSVGFEFKPTSSLRIGGQFYSVNLQNALGTLNPANTATYSTNPDKYTYNVTQTQYQAILATLVNGPALLGQQPLGSNIALVTDTRIGNLNAAKIEGIDFHLNYATDVSFGRMSFDLAGTRATRALITNGGVTTNQLNTGSPQFTAIARVRLTSGGFSSGITLNYSGRFKDAGFNNLSQVEEVDPFAVFNLNLGYDLGEEAGMLGGTSLRLGIDNLFEKKPQTIKRLNTNNPSYNNWTFGRVIKLGISKKF